MGEQKRISDARKQGQADMAAFLLGITKDRQNALGQSTSAPNRASMAKLAHSRRRQRMRFVLGAGPFLRKVVAARSVAQDGLDSLVIAVLTKVNLVIGVACARFRSVSESTPTKWNQFVLRSLVGLSLEINITALHFAQRRLEFAVRLGNFESCSVGGKELV